MRPYFGICRKCEHYAAHKQFMVPQTPVVSIQKYPKFEFEMKTETIHNVCGMKLPEPFLEHMESMDSPKFHVPNDCPYQLEHTMLMQEVEPWAFNRPYYVAP